MSPQAEPTRLLILIPAYNEQAAIRGVVSGVRQVVPQADILVVDDGSTDDTAQQAELSGALVVRHPFNLGIGGTVQTGLKFAQRQGYDLVIRVDGDGQHDPRDIPLLHSALLAGQADVVIGSRFLATPQNLPIPRLRRMGIRVFALMVSLLTGCRATDTTSGFFALNRRAIDTLVAYMPQDYPEVEGRIVLHKAGLTAVEIPAHMQARRSGVTSITAWRSIYYAVKVSLAASIGVLKDIPPVT